MKYGTLYMFKDGQVKKIKLTIDHNYLKSLPLQYQGIVGNFTSNEEREMFNSIMIPFKMEELYKNVIEDGYSLMRIYYPIDTDSFSVNPKKFIDLAIAECINERDAANIMTISQANIDVTKVQIQTYYIDELGKDYDFISLNGKYYIDTVDVLLREKLGDLKENEQKMMEQYRIFDLKHILLGLPEMQPINTGNTGVIVITKNRLYKMTVRKEFHDFQISAILSSINNQEINYHYGDNVDAITVSLYPGSAIFALPKKMTEFQCNEAIKILDEIAKYIDKESISFAGLEVNTGRDLVGYKALRHCIKLYHRDSVLTNIGITYIIHDGQVIHKVKLHIDDNVIADIKKDYDEVIRPRSVEETIFNESEFDPNFYSKLLSENYSIVRIANDIKINDHLAELIEEKSAYILLGSTICKKDCDCVFNLLKQVESDIKLFDIRSYFNNNMGIDYEGLYFFGRIKPVMLNVISTYMREKLGIISDDEKEMFAKYRTFPLDNMLQGNKPTGLINNRNAGVMIITNHQTIKEPLCKENHCSQINYIMHNLTTRLDNYTIYDDIPEVIVQFDDHKIIFIPPRDNKINSYKLQQMNDIVTYIKNKNNQIEVYTAIYPDDKSIERTQLTGFKELEEYLTMLSNKSKKR